MFWARKDDDYKGKGDLHDIWLWISQNYLSVENHLCCTGRVIYLSSQKAADTNITNTRLWVSITGINSIWPGWILFPSLATPMCQYKFWTQNRNGSKCCVIRKIALFMYTHTHSFPQQTSVNVIYRCSLFRKLVLHLSVPAVPVHITLVKKHPGKNLKTTSKQNEIHGVLPQR